MIASAPWSTRAHDAATPAAPPWLPDTAHVCNGCYVSTTAYIVKFLAEFPGERAEPLTVSMLNADGCNHPHTIALLTWRDAWWGRDEYFGVFALERPVGDGLVTEAVRRKAEASLERHAEKLVKAGQTELPAVAPARMPARQRAREIAAARAMLPIAAERFWVKGDGEEFPFLYFRPGKNRIAVYDPLNGTATAECAIADGAKVVAAVATRLGYRVDTVRAEFVPPAPVLLAVADPKGGAR